MIKIASSLLTALVLTTALPITSSAADLSNGLKGLVVGISKEEAIEALKNKYESDTDEVICQKNKDVSKVYDATCVFAATNKSTYSVEMLGVSYIRFEGGKLKYVQLNFAETYSMLTQYKKFAKLNTSLTELLGRPNVAKDSTYYTYYWKDSKSNTFLKLFMGKDFITSKKLIPVIVYADIPSFKKATTHVPMPTEFKEHDM